MGEPGPLVTRHKTTQSYSNFGLKLSADDFQWLVQTQPAVRAELANVLAERLRQR